jgi:hypothetical protein
MLMVGMLVDSEINLSTRKGNTGVTYQQEKVTPVAEESSAIGRCPQVLVVCP